MSYEMPIAARSFPSTTETYSMAINSRPSVDTENGSSQTVETPHNVNDVKVAESRGRKVPLGEEELLKIIERVNKAIEGPTTTLKFSIHEKTKDIMVKVLDKDTGKVIREIPPEKIMDVVAGILERAGMLIDERR